MPDRRKRTKSLEGFRRTKIVATIGPASAGAATLRDLVDAGVDVVRLNFSHGTHAEKAAVIEAVRAIEANVGRPIAILQDIQGPKIRVGPLPGPISLEAGARIEIHAGADAAAEGRISTTYEQLAAEVSRGDAVFIDDGAIELRVTGVDGTVVLCEVVIGGELTGGKGVNLPGANLSVQALTEKDRVDIAFGAQHGVDYVALSFVRRPADAEVARAAIEAAGGNAPLLAKVEKREAVAQMRGVLRAFDGVMVARGDLGVELRPESVPGVQKRLIATARSLGRPAITATQMLESMTLNRRPTRAEASDVANAVLDGTHAVMLSGETAVGRHPVEVVRAMHRIVVEAERIELAPSVPAPPPRSAADAVCRAATDLAKQVGAVALVALTRSGRTAQTLSSLQPGLPVIALSESVTMARRLCLWRGVMPIVIGPARPGESAAQRMERELSQRALIDGGEHVVLLGAAPGTRPGSTNFIRLLRC